MKMWMLTAGLKRADLLDGCHDDMLGVLLHGHYGLDVG